MDDPLDHNQAEPGDISSALDVEQLDLNLYRSRSLSLPFQARGVFGGQVISQALVAATRCVKPEFTLHVRVRPHTALFALTCITHTRTVAACTYPSGNPSVIGEKKVYVNDAIFEAYFLLSASASAPLLYYVDRVRDGRSYSTRSVRAVQGGSVVFIMLCSFQIPEVWQPSRHWTMPRAPDPDDCKSEVEHIKNMAARTDLPEGSRSRLIAYAKVRYFITPFNAMGRLSCTHVSRERRVQSLSSMLVTSSMSSRDGGPSCIG